MIDASPLIILSVRFVIMPDRHGNVGQRMIMISIPILRRITRRPGRIFGDRCMEQALKPQDLGQNLQLELLICIMLENIWLILMVSYISWFRIQFTGRKNMRKPWRVSINFKNFRFVRFLIRNRNLRRIVQWMLRQGVLFIQLIILALIRQLRYCKEISNERNKT